MKRSVMMRPGSTTLTRSMARSHLLVELGAIPARHVDDPKLVVAEDFEGDLLARSMPPEPLVEILPCRRLLRVERDDHIALLDARARTRSVRHDPGDHDPFLERVGKHPQPG